MSTILRSATATLLAIAFGSVLGSGSASAGAFTEVYLSYNASMAGDCPAPEGGCIVQLEPPNFFLAGC